MLCLCLVIIFCGSANTVVRPEHTHSHWERVAAVSFPLPFSLWWQYFRLGSAAVRQNKRDVLIYTVDIAFVAVLNTTSFFCTATDEIINLRVSVDADLHFKILLILKRFMGASYRDISSSWRLSFLTSLKENKLDVNEILDGLCSFTDLQ